MPQEPSLGGDISHSLKASTPTPRAPVARDLIKRADQEEAVASRSEFRPWARVDTKNTDLLEADDDVQDRKREEVGAKR